MLKKIISHKISGTNNPLFWRAPTYHNFIFNFQFLYDLKTKVRLSKMFPFRLIKVYIFVQQNA